MTRQSLKRLVVDPVTRGLVAEAAVLVVCLWVGVHVLGYARLRSLLDRYARFRSSRRVAAPGTIYGVRWAIAAVSGRFPPATCLVSALAASAMLRRRGIASRFRIGVRATSSRVPRLEAHAWEDARAWLKRALSGVRSEAGGAPAGGSQTERKS